MELRHKTCLAIKDEYKVTRDKLSIETAETNGFYELWLELVDNKKYCDLMSLAAKIYGAKRFADIVNNEESRNKFIKEFIAKNNKTKLL